MIDLENLPRRLYIITELLHPICLYICFLLHLSILSFGAWLFLARSLYAFQMYNEPNERSFTTDFMHARLLFFLLFVCVDFVVVVVIAEFHYYFFQLFFFRPINEQTDQSTSQPVRQSLNNKDFMSGILYTHTL